MISLSIILISLTYYYWDNISEVIDKIKSLKLGDGSSDSTGKTRDIEHVNLDNISSLPDRYEILSNETFNVLTKIERKIKIYNHIRGKLSPDRLVSNNIEFIPLFEDLKFKYIENIEFFNKIDNLKIENGDNILKVGDRMKMLKNINIISETLSKHNLIIPDYNLNLDSIPTLNFSRVEHSSPQLVESALQLGELNTKVEQTWCDESSSPGSDDTIKPSNRK